MKLACYSCLSKDIPAIILAIYILSEMLKVLLSFWIMRCFGALFQSRELFVWDQVSLQYIKNVACLFVLP